MVSGEQPDAGPLRHISSGFLLLALLTYALIVLGALVRSHGAGLACPDWPLCFGSLVPEFDLKVGFEWSHRVLAGSVALLFAALSVATLRAMRMSSSRRAINLLIALGAGALAIQIVLGALTVWLGLASWTVTAHLLTGNLFAVLLLFISRSLSDLAQPPTRHRASSARLRAALIAAGLLLAAQMLLGGWVSSRFLGLACAEWPQCMDGEWFPSWTGPQGIHLLHRTNAYLLAAVLAGCAWWGRGQGTLSRLLGLSLVIVFAQVAVGIANVLLRLPVEITGLHSALAAALVASLALALREALLRARLPHARSEG